MFGSCPGGSFRYCQRAAHVPIGRPGKVKGNVGGASGSNLMVSLLVVRHSGGGPPTGRLQGDYASLRWAISSRGAPPPGTTFLPPPTARPPHPAQKGNLPRGDYTGATIIVHSECTLIFRAPPAPQTRSILRPPTPANKHCPQKHHAEVVRPPTCVRQPSPSNSRCHARQSPRLAKRIVKFG